MLLSVEKAAWVACVLLVLACSSQNVCAQNNDYPFPNAPFCPTDVPATMCPQNTDDPYGFFYRECTSFVAWRMNRDAGKTDPQQPWFKNSMFGGLWGNADNWNQNATALGYKVDQQPTVGAIAQWRDSECANCFNGHVAYVESVNADGTVIVSEYNYSYDHGFDSRTTQAPRYIHINFGPNITSVVDSGGFSQRLSPGTLFTIFGQNLSLSTGGATTIPLPPSLNGTTILINGIAAPILWTSPTQVNAQLPFETNIGIAGLVVQVANAATISSQTLTVSMTSPGVFTTTANGITIGAIEHGADRSLVNAMSPAKPGEVISIYLTGLGATNPTVATGQGGNGQTTVLTPTVMLKMKARP